VIFVARRVTPVNASLSAAGLAAILGCAALAATLGCAALAATGCATPPKVTAMTRRIEANPRAVVEGRVRDLDGRPVAGIGVRGIPRGAAIPWAPPAPTACDGSFRLSLPAPATYGFLLVWKDQAIVTADPRDPAHVEVSVAPGRTISGIELFFLGDEWRAISEAAPADTPSCP
jgi:hypothetical protein